MKAAMSIVETQLEAICREAGCAPEDVPGLTTLDASCNSYITDAGLAHVPGLTTLYASGNSRITDAGLAHVPGLTTLDAAGNPGITDAGLAHVPSLLDSVIHTARVIRQEIAAEQE